MSLSPQDWKDIEEKLSGAYGLVELRIDGYAIALAVVRIKTRQYAVAVYVNGWIRGEWLKEDCEERRRFYHKKRIYFYSPKERERQKKFNKKHCGLAIYEPDKFSEVYSPFWTSFRHLKAHLIKNNTSIERVTTDDHQSQ